jgi:hypothetical protein
MKPFLISTGIKWTWRSAEKQTAYDLAVKALDMKQKNPGSKLWRMRVRQALVKLEKFYGVQNET